MSNKDWKMFLVAGVLCMVLAPIAQAAVVTDGLVSWWKFDETGNTTTAVDSQGSNDGTLNNFPASPTWTTDTPGSASSGALYFDGDNDYVGVLDDSTLDISTAITMEAWIKTSVVADMYYVLNKGNQYTQGYGIGVRSTPKAYVNLRDVAGGYTNCTIPTDEWVHIAYTYDSADTNGIRLYVDGGYVGEVAGAGSISTNNDHLVIGCQGNLDWNFKGTIDDVRIYNKALGAAEIQLNYNAIPEPATMTLLLLGLPLALRRRK